MSEANSTKPVIEFPNGEPPTSLEITDITVGDGAEAKPGGTVRVHYLGVDFASGEEFDSSWSRGEPIDCIKGWRFHATLDVGDVLVTQTCLAAQLLQCPVPTFA